MKKGAKSVLPVEIDCGLDEVSGIRFKLQQGDHAVVLDYPSAAAQRIGNTNTVQLVLTAEQTMGFDASQDVLLDTLITLTGTDVMPDTDIVRVDLLPTLFTAEEINHG